MSVLLKFPRPAARVAKNVVGIRRYGGEENYIQPTMNEWPVPQGSWSEAYAKKNARGNALLAVGIVCLSTAIAHAYSSRLEPLEKKDFPYNPSK